MPGEWQYLRKGGGDIVGVKRSNAEDIKYSVDENEDGEGDDYHVVPSTLEYSNMNGKHLLDLVTSRDYGLQSLPSFYFITY